MSRNLRIYNDIASYENDIYSITNFSNSVSFITELNSCYYHKRQKQTKIYARIPDSITIDDISKKYAGKIPVVNRTDLISSIYINGIDCSEYLHKGPELSWISSEYDLMKTQFEEASYLKDSNGNITGYTDYVITQDINSENLHDEFTIEIQWKDGVTDLSFAFYNTFITSADGDFFNNRKESIFQAEGIFANCYYLTEINDNLFKDCVNLKNIRSAFENCTSLNRIGNYAFSNCSSLSEITDSFKQCTGITEIGDYAFNGCSSIKDASVILLGSKNIKKIGNGIFKDCKSLTNIGGLFIGCQSLTDVGDYLFEGCNSITIASYLFAQCNNIQYVPSNIFKNCENIKDIYGMFSGCTSLKSVGGGIFSDLANLANAPEVFEGCSSLETINNDLFSNCKNILNFSYTFNNCTSLTEIPEHLFDNNINVTTFYGIFNGCTGLKNIPERLFELNKKTTAFSFAFAGCTGLTGNVPVDDDNTPIYNRSGSGKKYYSVVTYATKCFQNCIGLSDYNSIPNDWK